jgi:uncharacterized protein Veg
MRGRQRDGCAEAYEVIVNQLLITSSLSSRRQVINHREQLIIETYKCLFIVINRNLCVPTKHLHTFRFIDPIPFHPLYMIS